MSSSFVLLCASNVFNVLSLKVLGELVAAAEYVRVQERDVRVRSRKLCKRETCLHR